MWFLYFFFNNRAVRYEDLSLEPYEGVMELFKFFGLDFHPQVRQFLDTHTKTNAGGVSSTFRNSKAAPFHWRQDLSHREVRAIQRVCRPAMAAWGYLPAYNVTHQREFNPITSQFTLAWYLSDGYQYIKCLLVLQYDQLLNELIIFHATYIFQLFLVVV